MNIPFNRPLVLGTEQEQLYEVFKSSSFAANGKFTERCHQLLQSKFAYEKVLLTTSCTSALELAALVLNAGPEDEVIVPSYAFVTTANAFAKTGAKIVFVDSRPDNPNLDENQVESLINPRTKAIVALHYGGVSCEMNKITSIAKKHNLKVVEDNAQGIGASYNGLPLGGIGDFGAISFHETKNVHCGEGGALMINNASYGQAASVAWDMGTNKADYRSGKVDSYGWVEKGSSYYPSELNAAFLLAQLEQLDGVNQKRLENWNRYFEKLKNLENDGKLKLPQIPTGASHNAHTFYLLTESKKERDELVGFLGKKGIGAPFHFQSLHKSPYFTEKYDGPELVNADRYTNGIIRLPLFHDLSPSELEYVVKNVQDFYRN